MRYADDVVFGFQYRSDAEKFLEALRSRLGRFNLQLHDDKTRLIEFGRFAEKSRRRKGKGKPDTFDFLGFTHICGLNRNGKFIVLRHSIRKRMRAKLKEIKRELRLRMHASIPELGKWLRAVLRGHYNYYRVPRNGRAMNAFRYYVGRLWFRTLRRRSRKTRINWERMERILKRWLPYPKIRDPYPEHRLRVFTRGRSPVRQSRTLGSVRGVPGNRHSYRDWLKMGSDQRLFTRKCPVFCKAWFYKLKFFGLWIS